MAEPPTTEELAKIIKAYNALVDRALKVVSDVPFLASVYDEFGARVQIYGDEAVLTWVSYWSDNYGGVGLDYKETRFPASALLLSDDELVKLRVKTKIEEAERQAKVYAAQQAVERVRREAHDRAASSIPAAPAAVESEGDGAPEITQTRPTRSTVDAVRELRMDNAAMDRMAACLFRALPDEATTFIADHQAARWIVRELLEAAADRKVFAYTVHR